MIYGKKADSAPAAKSENITIAPSGELRFNGSSRDWEEKLFRLGARLSISGEPAENFWQVFARACLVAICHYMPDVNMGGVATVSNLRFSDIPDVFAGKAPAMHGVRLTAKLLRMTWTKLLNWCSVEIVERFGVRPFLKEYAPAWTDVGRIFFLLGENRLDMASPFVFMAAYVSDLNEKGEPRFKPYAEAMRMFEHDVKAYLRLFEIMRAAGAELPWLARMLDDQSIYSPQTWTPRQAWQFLSSYEKLERFGIGVRVPDWWKKRPRLKVKAEIDSAGQSLFGMDSLLKFNIGLALGNKDLSEAEIEDLLDSGSNGLALVKNQWVEVDKTKLEQALAHWRKMEAAAAGGEMNFIQGMRLLSGLDDPAAGAEQAESIRQWSHVTAGKAFRGILRAARADIEKDLGHIPGLQGQLRPYQLHGVAWMRFLNSLGLGACLADDMGLGKTIQVLALQLLEKEKADMPALLVAPASLMDNWRAEAARFAPDLRLLMLHPAECKNVEQYNSAERLRDYDLIVTSYGMAGRLPWLAEINWSRIIADEAQNIKNSRTRQSIAVRRLKGRAKIALTGTPIENSLKDLWSLFDFINPGLFGGLKDFSELLKKMNKEKNGFAPLRKLAAPYILRRMKTDKKVIDCLPDKTEVNLSCNLSPEQARLYKKVVEDLQKGLSELKNADEAPGKRNMLILRSLVLLKQICNHPAQAGALGKGGYEPSRSGKFQKVAELCETIATNNEKLLVFTQFREIIPALEAMLAKIFGRAGLSLHGGTPIKKRAELVEEFQREDGPPFFILSLKAGGSGLNLTQATHVIHFDRWWNPAVEDQATDRSYRIGQKRSVLVHKCLTQGTLEEKIDQLIASKRDLAEQVLGGTEKNITDMSDEQIIKLVRLDARAVMD